MTVPERTHTGAVVRGLRITDPAGRTVVNGVDLDVAVGECVALVGESGAGKSLTGRSLLGLIDPVLRADAHELRIGGRDLRAADERTWRDVRGREVGLVHQDALVSLDPVRRARDEVAEPLALHRLVPRGARGQRVRDLLLDAGVAAPDEVAHRFAHQISGGQRQRVLLASALAGGPRVLVADEPTTALDRATADRVLATLRARVDEGVALLLITHDLDVVGRIADRVLVMKDGEIVERAPTSVLRGDPRHPYTRRLLASVPHPRATPVDPPQSAPVLEVRSVRARHAGATRAVLDGIDLSVSPGECVGIVGESGSGKSTLARVVLRLQRPTEGVVTVGREAWNAPRGRGPTIARRRLVQLVPQDPLSAFDPRFTARQVIDEAVAPSLRGSARDARIGELVDSVRFDRALLDRLPRHLSGGQRQRVAIARALAADPVVLVADEPTSALDVTVQADILALLERLRADGLALLLISHDLAVVRSLATRVLELRGGALHASEDAQLSGCAPRRCDQFCHPAGRQAKPGRA